jgi:hypothetical protein
MKQGSTSCRRNSARCASCFCCFRGVFDEENEDVLPKRKRADFSALIIRNILHDVSNLTGQDSAKHFNGMGADAFIPF